MLPRRARPAARRDGSPGAASSGSNARAASWAAPTVAKFRCRGRSGRRARARSRPTGSLSRTARSGSLVGRGRRGTGLALACPASPMRSRGYWGPSRLLGASGCSRRAAWWRMPTMPAVPHAASAHAGAGTPASCRRSTLLRSLVASSSQPAAGASPCSWVGHCPGTAHGVPGPAAPRFQVPQRAHGPAEAPSCPAAVSPSA
jgi:hypothetical protein